ncbi:unnamed protein product [Parnassius apollo]|nr:unnamed protein product [Parnassius apollo]
MCKYAPLEPKIDHQNIDRNLLYIREAICRFSCYSRPPVPLSNVLMYLKGDYVHYCLPMFNHYFAHLPRPLSLKFVEVVLNAPLSIQKHGLRLAFKSYSAGDLKKLVLSVWKKTKNVSLRLILYKCLFQKILNEEEVSQKELYKALKVLTSELRDDDHNDIFDLILSDQLPKSFRGDYLETAWTLVSKLREKGVNIERQAKVLRNIKTNITLMDRDFLMEYIVKPHIHEMLIEKKIRPSYKSREISERVKTKWELVAKFIVTIENEETSKTSIDLVTSIIKTCAEMWDEVHDERYTIRLFCTNFISSLRANSNAFFQNFKYVNCIFERVLFTILEVLPSQEIYLTIWDLWLVIITRKVCSKMECDENGLFKNIEYDKICDDYANEIGDLIVDLVNKEQFYRSFLPHIAQVVNNHISVFSCAIKECADMVRITICNNLTHFKLPEIYLLVLMLLPTDCPHAYFDTCKDTLQKIKEIDNNEIQSYLYQKFLREDFKRRKFV